MRESGYYWVVELGAKDWSVMFFLEHIDRSGGRWINGYEWRDSINEDKYFYEINETRIKNPDEK